MNKIFVEIGYYELLVRPIREDDVPTYYNGAGGVFENHKNAFRTLDSCINHLQRKKYDDYVCVHISLKDEFENRFGYLLEGIEGNEFEVSDCGQYLLLGYVGSWNYNDRGQVTYLKVA